MAGYPFKSSSPSVNNNQNTTNHQNNRNMNQHHPNNLKHRFSTSFWPSSGIGENQRNNLNKPKSFKILKNKLRQKMNSFQSKEVEKFKKMLFEQIMFPSNFNVLGSQRSLVSEPEKNDLKISSRRTSSSSFLTNDTIQSPISQNPVSFTELVKLKGFTAIPSDVTIQNSLNKTTITSENKLDRIQSWTLPKKSHDFKSSIENNFSLLCATSTAKPEKNDETKNDLQVYEKLNYANIFKKNRESFTTKIKTMFEPFISFNFYCKFKRFIPYIQQDHEISERAQIEEEKEVIVPLTDEIEDELNEILNSPNRLLVSAYSINIYTNDIMTLYGSNWLNDAVIEFYLNLIVSRSQQQPKLPSVYAFSTYFFTRLLNGSSIGRWANKFDFFSYDLLIVPIHHSKHWRLVVIDNNRKCIEYYDSLGLEFRHCVDLLAKFLQMESLNKKKIDLDMNEWKLVYKITNIPMQKNYFDCGVFACKYAEFVARRSPLTFNQEHIPGFRKCMMYEIIHKQLLS